MKTTKKQKILKAALLTLVTISLFTGCTTKSVLVSKSGKTFNTEFAKGNYLNAAKIAEKEETVIGNLNSATAYRNAKDYKNSSRIFDLSEKDFKADDTKGTLKSIGNSLISVVGSDKYASYPRKTYEGIMVNTYKGINFMLLNDNAQARVEFNRVLDRQRRAKEYFDKEVAEHKKEKEKKKKELANKKQQRKKQSKSMGSIASNKKTASAIDKQYSNLFEFEAYPDFVNPYATYMAGLYFLKEGDYSKSIDLFKEVYGMEKKNKFVKSDFELASKRGRLLKKKKFAWVIIEDGMAMKKVEKRIPLPLFLFNRKGPLTATIVLPSLKENTVGDKQYVVSNGKKKQKALILGDIDRVIKTEFKKRFDMIRVKALMSTILKTYAKYELAKKTGLIGQILGEVADQSISGADTRMWNSLPKRFMLAKVELGSKPVQVMDGNANIVAEVPAVKGKNMILFIKKQTPTSKVTNETIYF